MNFIFLIQARSTSTRLPNKVLEGITDDKNLIETVYERVLMADPESRGKTWVLIPRGQKNDNLARFLKKKGIPYFRGSEDDVYLRFFEFLRTQKKRPDYVFRICSDNPFIEPIFIRKIIAFLKASKKLPDYISFKDKSGTPAILTHSGFFCEAIKYSTFIEAKKHTTQDHERMHVTPIFYRSSAYKTKFLPMPAGFENKYLRCTIDTLEDLNLIKNIYRLVQNKKNFSYKEIISIIKKNPKFLSSMKKSIRDNKK